PCRSLGGPRWRSISAPWGTATSTSSSVRAGAGSPGWLRGGWRTKYGTSSASSWRRSPCPATEEARASGLVVEAHDRRVFHGARDRDQAEQRLVGNRGLDPHSDVADGPDGHHLCRDRGKGVGVRVRPDLLDHLRS